MRILRDFRALTEAVHRLCSRISELIEASHRSDPAEARLEDLERSRSKWEAEIEARIMKAESIYKSANNAESRARTMEKTYAKFADSFDLEGEEEPETVSNGDAGGGEEERLLPLRLDVAELDGKEQALRAKFS